MYILSMYIVYILYSGWTKTKNTNAPRSSHRPFRNLILFHLYLKKTPKLFGYLPTKKLSMQNLKPIFPEILRIFDLEYHAQTSLKFTFVMFGFAFIKFMNGKAFTEKIKSSIFIELRYFHYSSHPYFMGLKLFSKYYSEHFIDVARLEFKKGLFGTKITDKTNKYQYDSLRCCENSLLHFLL